MFLIGSEPPAMKFKVFIRARRLRASAGGVSGALAASANLLSLLPTSEVPGRLAHPAHLHHQRAGLPDADAERLRLAHPSWIARKCTLPAICLTCRGGMTAVRRSAWALIPSAASRIDQLGEATGSVSGQLTIGIRSRSRRTTRKRGPCPAKARARQRLRVKAIPPRPRLPPAPLLRLPNRLPLANGEGGGICRFEQRPRSASRAMKSARA